MLRRGAAAVCAGGFVVLTAVPVPGKVLHAAKTPVASSKVGVRIQFMWVQSIEVKTTISLVHWTLHACHVRSKALMAGHLGAHMQLAPGLGQLHLALALRQFFFLLGRALVVAMGAAHAQNVMR